jgi:hypothetical protein
MSTGKIGTAVGGGVGATVSQAREIPPNGSASGAMPAEKIQSEKAQKGGNNSVVLAEKVQSFTSGKKSKTTEKSSDDDGDVWRFEIKRKRRNAGRKNSGSTARNDWYYWVIRVRKSDGLIVYYGTLDVLDQDDPERLKKYWKRSKERKNGRNRGRLKAK